MEEMLFFLILKILLQIAEIKFAYLGCVFSVCCKRTLSF